MVVARARSWAAAHPKETPVSIVLLGIVLVVLILDVKKISRGEKNVEGRQGGGCRH